MRVFLAGATGYVGGEIREKLVGHGHTVTGLARSPGRTPAGASVRLVAGDVAEPAAWSNEVRGHDAVINAVGLLRERGANTFQRAVVGGTRNLVEAAERHHVGRFVQVSANGVDAGRVAYQRTKLEAERIVRGSKLSWTIFRPSVIYGPRDDFTNKLARMMRLGAMPYFGRGDYRLAPVASWDVAEAVVQSLARPAAAGQTFTICGPEALSYREMVREIRTASGRRSLVLPAPKWVGYAGAALFGWIPAFPADRDALTMLFAGNTCPDHRWGEVLGIQATPFREGIRRYLGRRSA